MDDYDFDFGGSNDFDYSSYLGDSGSTPDIDFSGFDNLDISSLLGGDQGIDFSQLPGDFGSDLSSELAAALQDTGDSSSLFSGDGGLDLSSIAGDDANLAAALEGVGDFDQAAPPSNIADLLSSMNPTSAENLANTDWESLYKEGLTDEQIAKR